MKHPNIEVQLTGEDGNVFGIIGRVVKALRQNKVSKKEIEEFRNSCMSSENYNEVIQKVMKWVNVK